jgi:menaquinone-specific isochorismate synthase
VDSGSAPRLFAVSRPLEEVPSAEQLLGYADPRDPLVWMRGDRGCVGVGEVLRLGFEGPDRFADAAAAWRGIAERATVDDAVGRPGTGLLAFGSFAFADDSTARSSLVVPRFIVARHLGTAWLTEISTEPPAGDPALPAVVGAGSWRGVELPVEAPDPGYLAGVAEATARIERGGVEKVVLARRVEGRIAADDDLRVPVGRLAQRYEDCWTFAVDGMVGASPETLVRRTEGVVSARVLAGTRGRKADPAADARARDELLANAKEQHEHAFAVQSVVTALGPHVSDLECGESPFALELPNVWHLATDLTAVPSRGASSLELVEALHPTAAVAGTPTRVAVAAIAELEPFDRERYAGAVGWIDAAGDGEWVIALRCAQVGEARPPAGGAAGDGRFRAVTAYAGGGILADSDPQREFGETVSKFRPVAEAFSR